jgi:Protein of unknown function (DUF3592)
MGTKRQERPPQEPGRGRGPRWWRARRGYVLVPFAVGLAFGGVCLWSGLVLARNQSAFAAHAVTVNAVIAQLYASAPSQGYGPATFDQYALVHVRGAAGRARVLLAAGCTGVCIPKYHVGQVITVDYSPQNPGYAQLDSRERGFSASELYSLWLFGFLAALSFVVAIINMITA